MPIVMQALDATHTGPRILCDVCRQQIHQEQDGHVVFSFPEKVGENVPMYFVHKGACDRVMEKLVRGSTGKFPGWDPLEFMLIYLENALEMDRKGALARVESCARLG